MLQHAIYKRLLSILDHQPPTPLKNQLTEYEKVWQELVAPRSVLLKDFHVDSRADHKEKHEDGLNWNVDLLDGSSTQCPCLGSIWGSLVRLKHVSDICTQSKVGFNV